MVKRAHSNATGPFLSRKFASDILRGDVNSPGSFIEGRIFSMNPRKNQFTLDAKPTYLDIVIEDKIQKRLGELIVGDRLRILLQGAQILPYSGASMHVPAILRFREGITVLLVSRQGLQGEKEKFFRIWPDSNAIRAKRRKQALSVDNPDMGWFSTPPSSDHRSATTVGSSHLTELAEPWPHEISSHAMSPTPSSHPEVAQDEEASVTTSVTSSISRTSPLSTARSCGAVTYAYKTAPYEQSTSDHPISIPELSVPSISAIPSIAASSTSKKKSDRNSVPPSRGSSEQRNSNNRKKPSASAAAELATIHAFSTSPPPIGSVPVVPITVQSRDPNAASRPDHGQIDVAVLYQPYPITVAQPTGEQAGSGEDVDNTRGVVKAESSLDDPALNMRAGLIVNGWPYTALSEIRNSALMSVIGVVSFVAKEPRLTQKGEWCTCFSLLDPSVLDSFGGVLYVNGAGIKINCFMRLEQWLPNPKLGDVILLRCVKIQLWNDNVTGTCHANTMQWAIFDPLTEEVSQPDLTLSSHRAHHAPTWCIVSQEREYCVQLARWWAAVRRTRVERQGAAIQIGGGPVVALERERKQINRQHLLISEADPRREPRGYFNCTVEILHGHANHVSDIYSVYVTDYTSKSGTFVDHSSEWCPASLADRVLRIEMWRDKAVALAQQMNPGEYWSFDNVRMKVSNGGYIEGSFSEADKARKLSVSEVDTNPHLQALLQRKKVWEDNDTNPHVFPHKLFNQVELQSIFDCTVEVLHAEYNATGTSLLYITDYTERSDLATPPTALWSRGLPGRIVTLELQGQQSKMADKIESGAFFTVKHLRLIERIMGVGKVVGRIGGPDRLIHKLNANNPNGELTHLLERKREWKEEAEGARRYEDFTTIGYVLNSAKRVDKFRVRARVVGTFPLRLEDCVVRCCSSCSEQIPASADSCMGCRGTPEYENTFHLFLRLQDEHTDAQITVAVDEKSRILDGLTPDDVMSALGVFRDRLAGYIGNLEAVQAANSQGRVLEAKVPLREFTIESWHVGDDESGKQVIAYGLL
ncbi:hypothetical protein F5148DRAFT_1173785 [Russula earlei]|uniref:Uncharacterized protein n=1 Tax=Russula earlei TaxID=71964 RepID=A0ACC0UHB6_9AGAM|nr:hypothetical protein F5148DRAFT_1173785 [Russula earlei]